MVEYFGPDFIEKDIRTIPGSKHIIQTLREMEVKLKKELPQSYSLSLWMVNFLANDNSRQELILPENPKKEASYWLGFSQPKSYKLKDSLLVRITDRPQSFMSVSSHPDIDEIIKELRNAYDNREIERVKTDIKIPSRDWALHKSFKEEPKEVTVYAVYPQNKTNIADDFEEVLRKHNVLDLLFKKGYEDMYKRIERENVLIHTLT
jgi:hypothetical protein